ncbi:MAG: HK97 gp10 family phage protein [Elusimicrobia bacterium]|nr:HK97 gp10 family phage protein [Elusimicrobiota bacterium]
MIVMRVKGGEQTVKLLNRLPERLRNAVLRALREAGIVVQALAREKAPVYRGLLRQSIGLRFREESLNRVVGEVGSDLPYAGVMESGSSRTWTPPSTGLKQWARLKLGDERLGWAIVKKFRDRGFPFEDAQSYLTPAIKEALPRMKLIFEERMKEVIQQEGGTI